MSFLPNAYPTWLGTWSSSESSAQGQPGYLIKPIGEVSFTASARNPVGFLTCDGSIYTQSTYPDLALAVGQNYANQPLPAYTFSVLNSAVDFAIPNLTNVFALGGSLLVQSTSNFLNQTTMGGSSNVTLNVSNVPPHEHRFTAPTSGSGSAVTSSGASANTGNTNADIYNSNGTLVTSATSSPQPVSIMPPYNTLNSLVRASYAINPQWQVGYVNIDSTNNQFYAVVDIALTGTTRATYAVTLAQGYFTPYQMLNNMLNSIGTAVATAQGTACPISLQASNSYSISAQGNWVMKINMNNSTSFGLGFAFTTHANVTSPSVQIPSPNRVIPQAILDATADTLGFPTRSMLGTIPGAGQFTLQTGNFSRWDYFSAPKAFKIYWGSLGDATIPNALQSNIINSF